MPPWPVAITEFLWQNALAAIPLVLIVAAICKCVPCRPSTRHFLWLLVLVLLLAPRIAPPERLTRLVTAVLPASPEDPEPPATIATVRSNETVPNARLAIISPPERSIYDRRDEGGRHGLQRAPGADDPSRVEIATLKARCPAEEIRLPDRQATHSLSRANGGKKSARLPLGDVHTNEKLSEQDHGDETCKTRPNERVTTPPTHVAQEPRPVKSRLPANSARRYQAGVRDSSAALVKHRGSSPTVNVSQGTASQVASDARPTNLYAQPASDADVATKGRSKVWDETISRLQAQTMLWSKKLAGLRSLILDLPSVPLGLWLGGVITLLLLSLRRMHRFQRVLRRAIPAGVAITAEVAKAAGEMGVKYPPTTMMVQQRISPMILCGPKPKLILPVQLWSDLDRVSRHAVLCHELAHLRRRDHIVTWIEWIVGLIYWWNPLVWWVRHRLHEEAELACDQWVTWLLPRDRRAYAVALLRAKEFVSRGHVVVPAMSMGATTQTTRKLARRIKMVMTATSRPKLSVLGMALACALVTTAWLSGAAWACPPKAKAAASCCDNCKSKCDCSGSSCRGTCCSSCTTEGKSVRRALRPASRERRDIRDDEDGDLSTFEQYISGKKAPKAKKGKKAKRDDKKISQAYAPFRAWSTATALAPLYTVVSGDGDDSNLERFEARMRRLEERLERFAERMERQLERQTQRQQQRVPQVWSVPAMPRAPQSFFVPGGDDGEKMWRTYRLAEGKLQELTELMVRSDVPIFVRPHDDRIEVQGTPPQHRIFKAFVDMIDPPKGADAREVIRQQNLATDALVQRVQMESESRAMEVRARMLEQRSEQFELRAEELQMRAEELQSAAESLQDRLKTRALEQASGLIQEAQTLQNEAEVSGREAEELEVKAEELLERASELRDFLEVLQDQAKRAAEQAWWPPAISGQGELVNVSELVAPVAEAAPTPEVQEVGPEPVIAAPVPPAPEVAPEPKEIAPRR